MGEGIREDRKSEREAGWEGEKGEGREGGGRGRPGWERVKWGGRGGTKKGEKERWGRHERKSERRLPRDSKETTLKDRKS